MRTAKARAPEPVVLSFVHGAAYLDTPYTTFRKLAHDGAFPVVRQGRRLFVRRADLDAYIAANVDYTWTAQGSEKQFAAQRARRQREQQQTVN